MSSHSGSATECAVVLMNLGGPDSLADIEPFLYQLFADPGIITLPWWLRPWQASLAKFMAARRAPHACKLYEQIGGKSPLLDNTLSQARALETELAARGASMSVYVAMRCWHPLCTTVVDMLVQAGIKEVALLPLYPQESRATFRSSVEHFRFAARERQASFILRVAAAYPQEAGYITAICDTIQRALANFERPERVHMLFSAHSLPMSAIRSGDPYPAQIAATLQQIAGRLAVAGTIQLAYQSQLGRPGRWLGPSTHDTIKRLAAAGVKEMLLIPLGFVSEHLETLYEMDILYGDLARSCGMRFERVPAPGEHPAFISALADVALRTFEL